MRVRAARQRMGEGKEIDMEQHMGHGPIQWKKNFQISTFRSFLYIFSDNTSVDTCKLDEKAFEIKMSKK